SFVYKDKATGDFPRKYCQHNHLDYYVNRNKAIIDFLAEKTWVDEKKIVVAGHSEGVSIALKMAIDKANMSHLILLNGGVEGRAMAQITSYRKREKSIEDFEATEAFFRYWESLIDKSGELSDDCSERDSHKATFSFSFPYRRHFQKINILVFVGYGTKDESALLIDNFRIQAIQSKKKNFYFKSYFGLEHNLFEVQEDGRINYDKRYFDNVANDFFNWINTFNN
ncbi:MAG: acyl-CoA thioester hydrolase/BAAT C-terminal domain-containing protein, partial [Bacteroidota bacterium]